MTKHCFLIPAVCLILAGTAFSQTWSSPKLTSDVPYDFVVNGTMLPAGTYLVRTDRTGHGFVIQNRDKPEYAAIVNNNSIILPPDQTQGSTVLAFTFSDGQYVLHQIRIEMDDHIHDIIHGQHVPELVANN